MRMERFYTLLCVTHELHKSPAINMYGRLHDVSLCLGELQTISFLLPSYIHSLQEESIQILYNPDVVELLTATVSEQNLGTRLVTSVTITLTARDIGSTSIGITTEDTADIYQLASYEPHFIKNNPISSSR